MTMIYCRECGYRHSDKAKSCPKCGCTSEETLSKKVNKIVNGKSMIVYLLLAWFLGIFGAHRFYVGKTGSAVAMLLMGTIGWLIFVPGIIAAVWALVDFIIGICNLSTPEVVLKKD
ncbi:MAG: NINE protein [Alphaproteobacteria bacterium]|nr:NINE protein [Alphaproteobacteria bacterium]